MRESECFRTHYLFFFLLFQNVDFYASMRRRKRANYPQYYHLICIAFRDYLKFKFINSANIQTRRRKKDHRSECSTYYTCRSGNTKAAKNSIGARNELWKKIQYFSFFLSPSLSLQRFILDMLILFFSYPPSILTFCHPWYFPFHSIESVYDVSRKANRQQKMFSSMGNGSQTTRGIYISIG